MVDRISNLPDSLLSHILSFLTIKEYVATSILSSRWKLVWTLVPIVEFDANEFEWISSSSDEEESPNQQQDQWNGYRFSFTHIVSRFIALRNANPIQKFRLRWSRDCDPIHVDTCVRAVIACDLKELDLQVCPRQPFYLPSSLFSYAKTLVALKLTGYNIVLNPPSSSSVSFPSLMNLHLQSVKFANHDSFSRLISCCPVLQDLSMETKTTYPINDDNFKIIVPTLKRLHLTMKHSSYKLVINAPILEYIYFRGILGKEVLLENLSNLVEAVLDIYLEFEAIDDTEDYGNCVLAFIRALYSIKSLHLYADTTECLYHASIFDPPMFHNLAVLHLCVNSCMWHVLPFFLERAPNLEELILDKVKRSPRYTYDKCSITLEWKFYEDVPKCISLHLTAFHFKGYEGFNAELELVGQILKWARFLKKMTIDPLDSARGEEVLCCQEIIDVPKAVCDL
uniref:F-box domain-containing protein n=1 Tax=Fagus sylvatica TaxID=28930 RepID=A0A2N9F900_FAGSY